MSIPDKACCLGVIAAKRANGWRTEIVPVTDDDAAIYRAGIAEGLRLAAEACKRQQVPATATYDYGQACEDCADVVEVIAQERGV